MQETVRVVALEEGAAWIEKKRQSQCGGCRARHACGSAILSKVLGTRRNQLRVVAPAGVSVGQDVEIEFKEAVLIKASFMLYMLPLIGFFLGAVVGKIVTNYAGFGSEILIIFAALAGFFGVVIALRSFSNAFADKSQYQPKITRIVES